MLRTGTGRNFSWLLQLNHLFLRDQGPEVIVTLVSASQTQSKVMGRVRRWKSSVELWTQGLLAMDQQ